MVTILDRRLLHHRPSIPDLHFLNADFILLAICQGFFGSLKMFLN